MKALFIYLGGQAVILPFIIGLIRFRRIDKGYQPFFIMLAVGVLSELIDRFVIKIAHASNAVPSNIYSLLEWLLIAWQFHVWGFLRTRQKVFYIVLLVPALIWAWENLLLGHIREFPPYYRFFYCFLIVLLSVNKINFMITHDNRNLLRHPDFLICIAFIIYFIYRIIYEWAYQVSLFGKTDITVTIIFLFAYINALTNIIFAIALLMIPAPEKFTLEKR